MSQPTRQKEVIYIENIMKVGRPELYTQELADLVCSEISKGLSVRSVCAKEGMPSLTTFFKWIRENKEFARQYAYATEERTEAMAEDILDIADDGSNDLMTIQKGNETYKVENKEVTNRSRLRVDTRKWLMSKMKPKKYGEKIDMTTNGKDITIRFAGKDEGSNDKLDTTE